MLPPERMDLAALEAELRRRLRAEGYEVSATCAASGGTIVVLIVDSAASAGGFGDFAVPLATVRRPVIRDQGPPPVRRQPAPRPMRPPARRLSWLVEGRGR